MPIGHATLVAHRELGERIARAVEDKNAGVAGNVELAIENLHRVLKPGGICLSVSGVVPPDLRKECFLDWEWIRDGSDELKAGCFVLYEVARRMKEEGIEAPVELFYSNYEEVGHGGTTGYSNSVDELLVIDMGVVGAACDGTETACSICAKDSGGPYDYTMRTKLVELAEAQNIEHAVDVYPFYSSDGTAAWRAGVDARVALIGPGVAASHGMERTHVDGIQATVDLCIAYIKHRFG